MRRKRNQAIVVWDGGTEDFICRDERCTIYAVHLAHDISDTPEVLAARQALWGWMLDPCEPSAVDRVRETGLPPAEDLPCPRCAAPIGVPCATRTARPHSQRLRQSPLWLATRQAVRSVGASDRRGDKPAHVRVLDECILRVVTPITIKPWAVIETAVHNDYGSCEPRRLHRRLAALRDEGAIAHVQFGSTMISGYTTPDSALLHDPLHAEEIIWHQLGDIGREAA